MHRATLRVKVNANGQHLQQNQVKGHLHKPQTALGGVTPPSLALFCVDTQNQRLCRCNGGGWGREKKERFR